MTPWKGFWDPRCSQTIVWGLLVLAILIVDYWSTILACSFSDVFQNILSQFGRYDFPGGSDGKMSVYNAGDSGSIPGSGRSPGEGHSNPLQHSCLENPMGRGAWRATVHGVTKSRTGLRDYHFHILLDKHLCSDWPGEWI